jgi:hypothetical protein
MYPKVHGNGFKKKTLDVYLLTDNLNKGECQRFARKIKDALAGITLSVLTTGSGIGMGTRPFV